MTSETEAEIQALRQELIQEAYRLASRRLERREYSTGEMRQYLKRKGAGSDTIDSVLARLVREKLIDDSRFARAMTRHQLMRGKGALYIHQKLRQKGLSLDIGSVKRLVAELDEVPELEKARQIVESRYPNVREDRKEAARACQALVRRGFSYQTAFEAVFGSKTND